MNWAIAQSEKKWKDQLAALPKQTKEGLYPAEIEALLKGEEKGR